MESSVEYKRAIELSKQEVKAVLPIYTLGDGFCSIHAVILAYFANGGTEMYNQYEPIHTIKELRCFLINYIRKNAHVYSDFECETESLVRQLSNDTTSSIENHLIFQILSDILMCNIHVHYFDHVYSNYTKKCTTDIHIVGNGVHYQALLEVDKIRHPSLMSLDFRNWWCRMINTENIPDELKEKLRVSLVC